MKHIMSTWDERAIETRYEGWLTWTVNERMSRFDAKLQYEARQQERDYARRDLREQYLRDLENRRKELDAIDSPFAIGGTAAVLSETLLKLVNLVYKQRVTQKARNAAGLKIDYYDRFFDVTLKFQSNSVTIEYPVINEDREIVRASYPVRMIARVDQPFTVRLDLDTLRDVLRLMDDDRIDLEYRPLVNRLVLKQGRNRVRLVTQVDPLAHFYL